MSILTVESKRDIRTLLQSDTTRAQLALVLPKHLTPERMARVGLTAILKNPKLGQCSPESLLQAMMLCSQAGLEPDGRNAHLIPYGDQVQVIFDWKGLVSLAKRNGIQNIAAEIVCENDEFEWYRDDAGLHFKHRVNFKSSRGSMYAAYCIWKDGDQFDGEVMTKDEIEGIRKRSRAGTSGPWVTDFNEMAKKTVIRRASKKWPLDSDLAEAVNSDADSIVPEVVVNSGPSFFTPTPLEGPKFNMETPPTPRARAKTAPVSEPEPPKQPIAPPVDVPPTSPAPAQESAPEGSAIHASSPLDDLLGAMNEEGVSHEQMIAFAGKKGVLKEGTDKELAVMSDILPSKIATLAKMVRAKGTALKEMKG